MESQKVTFQIDDVMTLKHIYGNPERIHFRFHFRFNYNFYGDFKFQFHIHRHFPRHFSFTISFHFRFLTQQACRNYKDEDRCVGHCPPMKIVNRETDRLERNPNAKFIYRSQCVKRCPRMTSFPSTRLMTCLSDDVYR